jgi:hypothetical protein
MADMDLYEEACQQAGRVIPPARNANNASWPVIKIYHRACREMEAHPRHAGPIRCLAVLDMARTVERINHANRPADTLL